MKYSILLVFFLLLLQGFFAGIETSFLSLDLFFIEIKTEKKYRFSLLYYILKRPHILITTILIGTNISLIASTQIISRLMNIDNIFARVFLYFVYPFIVLILAEIYPKILFSKYSYTVAKIFTIPFFIFQIILSPIIIIFNLISRIVEMIFTKSKVFIDKKQNEEIKNILASSLQKKISNMELFIEDAVKFDEISLYDIQKPIFSLPSISYDENGTIDLTKFLESWQKIHIVYDNQNNFVGIMNIDTLSNLNKIQKFYKIEDLQLIKDFPVVYEGKNLLYAIEIMKKTKFSFIITINEFGQNSGLITKEDIFSFISNTIISNQDSYKYSIKKVGENSYIVPGFSELTVLTRTIGIDFNDDYYHTFNGYLCHHLGKIPKEGEVHILKNNIEVRIVSANKKFVEKAIIKLLNK